MNAPWFQRSQQLPIVQHLEQIAASLDERPMLVLKAPPGTGKTTVLPLRLLESSWSAGKKLLILQPRRLAAKSVAIRMSELLGEPVGRTVGYQMRLEQVGSKDTRIEIITEGILARRIISDPALEGVAGIIFDEFHERSIHADIGLALASEVATTLRPDLRIVVMSATLADPGTIPPLAEAASYEFSAATYPVAIRYVPGEPRLPLWERAVAAILTALQQHDGDLLAFLPGTFEIHKTESLLLAKNIKARVLPLYGELPPAEQERALKPDPEGIRKIILATPIAETSVTIDGVTIVVDSGYHKVARSEGPGSSILRTERISRDSSDQRAGRAGRTAPGVCIRLWSEQEQMALRPFREPEVLRADLASVVLDLAAWGVKDPTSFGWITTPPLASLTAATTLLRALGAIDHVGAITPTGRVLADLGAHPVLGRLAMVARTCGLESLASRMLALIEERDLLGSNASTADIDARLTLLTSRAPSSRVQRAVALADRWARRIARLPATSSSLAPTGLAATDAVGYLAAHAFPFLVGRRREAQGGRYLLANGRGCVLRHGDPLSQCEYIVALELKEGPGDSHVTLGAALNERLLTGPLAHLLTEDELTRFDDERGELVTTRRTMLGAISVREEPAKGLSIDDQRNALVSYLSTEPGFQRIPFSDFATRLRLRSEFARITLGETALPDLSDDALRASVSVWLEPFLRSPFRLTSITENLIDTALSSLLPFTTLKVLNSSAPETFVLPSGKERRIGYTCDHTAVIEATIQELFGLNDTPRLGRKQIPITVHLLSPARRPVQVTQDLANFWRSGYAAVRKELRGRYPKHAWPEDPLAVGKMK